MDIDLERTKSPRITVASFISAESILRNYCPQKIISLIDVGSPLPEFLLDNKVQSWSVLRCNDVTGSMEGGAPGKNLVVELFNAFLSWNGVDDVLFHCHQGVSRSSAAALLFLAIQNKHHTADNIMRHLRVSMPWADPNELIVDIGEKYIQIEDSLWRALMRDRGPNGEIPIPTFATFPISIKM
jgi:predicted protein tyrosine phosphatase